ncbi:MAG: 4-hydroxythreonine-4-phosphate dehydrogenase PdxA [Aestuariivirgaceae bacterium]
MGEPAGIAPDITIAAWRELAGSSSSFFLIGDAKAIAGRAKLIGTDCPVAEIEHPGQASDIFARALPVLPEPLTSAATCGQTATANADAVLASITRAVDLVCAGKIGGIVTNPIHKSVLYAAGFEHQGHTDFLAELARARGFEADPVMMLASGDLRTVPITVHIPLKDVPQALTQGTIIDQTRIIFTELQRRFGIAEPRIGMTGLNPHAGEDATMGLEERDVIAPAIRQLADQGIQVDGPLPADTVFHDEARARYDVIVCMYHDQALIPVKTIGFHNGVNTTLGLPFIRTSPDHGTALPLAGTGRANPSSLISAIRLAAEMVQHQAATR